jgi:hypothetical protein
LLQYAANLSGNPIPPGKCGLPAFAALHQVASKHPELAARFKTALQRPSLPLWYVTPDGRFRIHYTITGIDAVNPASTIPEAVAAQVPDYIYEAGLAAQRAYDLLVNQMGFDPPLSDRGVDGNEYDFYINNRPNSEYGSTEWESLDASGRAPTYSFADNDFAGYNTTGIAALRVTVAHEFFHGIQLNYRFRGDDVYFLEMSSTWFEDFAYDEINDYYFYLRSFFNNPERSLSDTDGYESCIWLHYLVKRTGESRIMLDLWKGVKVEPAIRTFKTVLESSPYNTVFSQAISEFNTWCYFTGPRADSSRYFEEGVNYPQLQFKQTVRVEKRDTTISGGLGAVAARFYRVIRDPQDIQAGLVTSEPGRWMVTAISRTNQQYVVRSGDGSTPIFVPASTREDTFVVTVVNTSLPANFSNYQLQLTLSSKVQLANLLEKPRPNPFRGKGFLYFPFQINQRAPVTAAILREDGKVLRSYELGELGAGVYSNMLFWDGLDDSGNRVSSGVYFLRLWAGGFHETTKFVVVN